MTTTKRRETIQRHIKEIHKGDVFPSAKALYTKLGLEDDKNGNKTNKTAVQKFLAWETTRGHCITITEVYSEPLPDGRSNNKGGNNSKYQQYIKPLLLHGSYESPITYANLFRSCYGVRKDLLDLRNGEKSHSQQYMQRFYDKLGDATETALNSLQNDRILKYTETYQMKVTSDKSVIGTTAPVIASDTKLLDFMHESGFLANTLKRLGDTETIEFLREILFPDKKDEENQTAKKLTTETTLFGFTGIIQQQRASWLSDLLAVDKQVASQVKSDISREKMLKHWKSFTSAKTRKNEKATLREKKATPTEKFWLMVLEAETRNYYGMDYQQFNYNSADRQKVYRTCGVIERMLGIEKLWRVLDIYIKKKEQIDKEYPLTGNEKEKLMQALEQSMADWATGVHYNPREASEKHLEKDPGWGIQIVNGEDTEVYYMAGDEAVSRLHCKLFNISPIDGEYLFKKYQEKHT